MKNNKLYFVRLMFQVDTPITANVCGSPDPTPRKLSEAKAFARLMLAQNPDACGYLLEEAQ
ncbi:MAG: hypothetical protein P4L87_25265 [Formivibrio sp.]|nr:hypothetical protein [Formivibrio sp.]